MIEFALGAIFVVVVLVAADWLISRFLDVTAPIPVPSRVLGRSGVRLCGCDACQARVYGVGMKPQPVAVEVESIDGRPTFFDVRGMMRTGVFRQ